MELNMEGCPAELKKFVNMRLGSAFFTQAYKDDLTELVKEAEAKQDYKPVEKFMWPELFK